MWRLLLGTMGVKSLVQGLNAAATAGFEPRTVWSEVRRRNRLATAPPIIFSFYNRHSITLPPLEKRFTYHTLIMINRVHLNLAPQCLCSLVAHTILKNTSGSYFRKLSYPVPLTRHWSTLNSFLPRPIILWNRRLCLAVSSHQTHYILQD